MTEDLKKHLYRQLNSVKELCAIVVSDRDGVPVLKVANENAPEFALRSGFLSTFPLASDLCGKLSLGNSKYFICFYGNHAIIHFNRRKILTKDCSLKVTGCFGMSFLDDQGHPLTISFIAESTVNTGLILNLAEELNPSFDSLKEIIKEVATNYNQN